jgi:general secretion pathway protein J
MKRLRASSANAGFTLIETLIATAMMVAILAALATVTAQWLPNWNRGFTRVQRNDLMSLGIERMVSDLMAAQYVPPHGRTKSPLFEGSELSVMFVRTAIGPNAPPGLEIVRFAELNDGRALAMVRSRVRYTPLPPDGTVASHLRFSEPVALLRSPYRVSFAYAGPDRLWQSAWSGKDRLPRAVRITVRDATTEQTLAVSTAALVHVMVPAQCIGNNRDPNLCN